MLGHTYSSSGILVISILTASFACGVDGPHPDFHECTDNLSYSSDWGIYDLDIEHTDPQICPLELNQPGDEVYTSADIFDNGGKDGEYTKLTVRNTDGEIVGEGINYFREYLDGRWWVYVNAEYNAGTGAITNYDTAHYDIDFLDGDPMQWAEMIITYSYGGCGESCF